MPDAVVELCAKSRVLGAETDALTSEMFDLADGDAESAMVESKMEAVNAQYATVLTEILSPLFLLEHLSEYFYAFPQFTAEKSVPVRNAVTT